MLDLKRSKESVSELKKKIIKLEQELQNAVQELVIKQNNLETKLAKEDLCFQEILEDFVKLRPLIFSHEYEFTKEQKQQIYDLYYTELLSIAKSKINRFRKYYSQFQECFTRTEQDIFVGRVVALNDYYFIKSVLNNPKYTFRPDSRQKLQDSFDILESKKLMNILSKERSTLN